MVDLAYLLIFVSWLKYIKCFFLVSYHWRRFTYNLYKKISYKQKPLTVFPLKKQLFLREGPWDKLTRDKFMHCIIQKQVSAAKKLKPGVHKMLWGVTLQLIIQKQVFNIQSDRSHTILYIKLRMHHEILL